MDHSQPVRVLVIEDTQFIYLAVKSLLGKERHFTYHTDWAKTLQEGFDLFKQNDYHIVLSSLCLADSNDSQETVNSLCKTFSMLPLIVLTGNDDDQVALQALRRGAQDYLTKEQISEHGYLARSIQYAIERKRNELERRRLIKELQNTTLELELNNNRYQRDLNAAAQIQQQLLPHHIELPPGYSYRWRFDPCDELAGDLLNVIPIDEQRIAFYVLDVSGHGLASALLGIRVHQQLTQNNKQILFDDQRTPRHCHDILNDLNREFQMQKPMLLYFTMLYGIIDRGQESLQFATAGHPSPFIHKSEGHMAIHESTGMPIGLMPDSTYETHTLEFKQGDRLYICSDGLYECTDVNNIEFGRKRLVEHIQNNHQNSLDDCLDDIMQTIREWHKHSPQQDDCSILSIELE